MRRWLAGRRSGLILAGLCSIASLSCSDLAAVHARANFSVTVAGIDAAADRLWLSLLDADHQPHLREPACLPPGPCIVYFLAVAPGLALLQVESRQGSAALQCRLAQVDTRPGSVSLTFTGADQGACPVQSDGGPTDGGGDPRPGDAPGGDRQPTDEAGGDQAGSDQSGQGDEGPGDLGPVPPGDYEGCAGFNPESTPALCADGLDNDCDGSTDCSDEGCHSLLLPCSVRGCDGLQQCNAGTLDPCLPLASYVETSPTTCDDDQDNDCDGLTDCADPGCALVPICQ